jgi:hypothetical protein
MGVRIYLFLRRIRVFQDLLWHSELKVQLRHKQSQELPMMFRIANSDYPISRSPELIRRKPFSKSNVGRSHKNKSA